MFNILYHRADGVHKLYAIEWMSARQARRLFREFVARYCDEHGNPKRFPNGKGWYDVYNPRIVTPEEVNQLTVRIEL